MIEIKADRIWMLRQWADEMIRNNPNGFKTDSTPARNHEEQTYLHQYLKETYGRVSFADLGMPDF